MAKVHLRLSVPSEFSCVRLVGVAVRAVLVELEYDLEKVSEIELCIVEAINNAIEHAYREQPGHFIGVEIAVRDADILELSISDSGRAMPEGALERARQAQAARDLLPESGFDLATVEEGGYGLGLILQLMHDVGYRQLESQNTLTMSMAMTRRASEEYPMKGTSDAASS